MSKNLIITCFFLLFVVHAQAQNEKTITTPRFRLGVEFGADALFGEKNKLPMIRENQSSYYYDYDYDYYGGFILDEREIDFFYVGLKPEYLIHKKLSISVGARFSFNKTVYDSDRDYFLWKVSESEDGMTTNYLKIKDISQKNYYIGIPIEVRFFPNERDYPVRQYFILGTSLNFLATSTEDVSFKNSAMNKYTPDVLNQIGRANSFTQCIYVGAGLKIGRTNHPFGTVEFHFPVFMMANDKPNALVKTDGAVGFGLQTSLQIPLFKKHQLTYIIND